MSDPRSALTETRLCGKVGTEFPHDVGVTLTGQFLSRCTVVFLDECGEGCGSPLV